MLDSGLCFNSDLQPAHSRNDHFLHLRKKEQKFLKILPGEEIITFSFFWKERKSVFAFLISEILFFSWSHNSRTREKSEGTPPEQKATQNEKRATAEILRVQAREIKSPIPMK